MRSFRPLARRARLSVVGLSHPRLECLEDRVTPGFAQPVEYGTPGPAAAVAITDLNGDGYADIVATSGAACVFINNGDGTFQPEVTYGTGAFGTRWVVTADLTGDGKP